MDYWYGYEKTCEGDFMSEQQISISSAIYCMAMRLTDAGTDSAAVDAITRSACEAGGVSYPPQLAV